MATQIHDIALRVSDPSDLDAILSALPVGVVVAEGPGGRFVFANDRARAIFGGDLPMVGDVAEYGVEFVGFRPSGRQYEADEWPLVRAIQQGEVVIDEEIEMLIGSDARRILLVSATPVRDEAGRVMRAIALFHDVTEQRQDERRRELLVSLSDQLRVLTTPSSIMEAATIATGEHLGVCSVSYADVDDSGEHAVVDVEYRNGIIARSGRYFLEDFGPRLVRQIRQGHAVAVEDIGAEQDAAHEIFEGWHYRSLIAVPIMRQGRLIAIFSVLHTAPRRWTGSDVALMENVAERTWQAVEKARAEAELRRSREILTLALSAGSAATWEWDLRSGLIRWSEEQSVLPGLPAAPTTMTFGRWVAMVHPEDRARARHAAREVALLREGEIELEYRIGTPPRWITMRGRVIAEGGVPQRVVGVAVDTTERKAAELERERLLEETRDASEAKSHFISVISHEFRTPLTAIIGYTDLLSTGVSGPLSPAQLRQLDRVRASAWHLTQMVDEILTFSRLEAGHDSLNLEPVDATSLARETAALVAPGASVKGLALACELPDEAVVVRSDSGKLRQVLLNLLAKAVKFTEHGGVTLRLRRVDDRLVIAVQDTGVGIAPEHIERVFERFWQAGGSQRHNVSGAGLGLTVSRHLVEMLGGRLEVESSVGTGTTFSFSIPA
ncbi:MAG TPA: ATP-binding protein [Longimicrobiales bacterium]|nr:ATP-binding protein [Longimicrobiales bacterium]